MPLFSYQALTIEGQKVSGNIEAQSKSVALEELNNNNLLPVVLVEDTKTVKSSGENKAQTNKFISPAKVTLFTKELAMLLKAGMPLDQCLLHISRYSTSNATKAVTRIIREQLSSGKSFHEALQSAGRTFGPLYINMVKVAEASGTLDLVLERIASTRQRAERLKSKIISALLYPSILLGTAICSIVIMLVFVVPRFKGMIINSNSSPSEATLYIIYTSDWLVSNGNYLLLAILGLLFSYFLMARNSNVAKYLEASLHALPFVGSLMRMNMATRFCRTLGTLLENGVDLQVAMKLTRNTLGNKNAETVIEPSCEALRKGNNFL